MVDPGQIYWSIHEKFYGRSRKNTWSIQEKFHGWSRKKSMADPEKITSFLQIQLGTMQSQTLPYFPLSLSLYPGKQNALHDLSPTPPAVSPITYHLPPPFVYEGPAVAGLLYNVSNRPTWFRTEIKIQQRLQRCSEAEKPRLVGVLLRPCSSSWIWLASWSKTWRPRQAMRSESHLMACRGLHVLLHEANQGQEDRQMSEYNYNANLRK